MTDHFHEQNIIPDPLARRVLDRIDAEKVAPRPRWEFVGENYLFWSLGALAVVLGAFAFSAALFEVTNASWTLYAATHSSFIAFFLSVAPFLWALVLVVFIGIGYANIRHTKRGYRYSLAVIALGAVLTSITLGTALYASGWGGAVEESIGDHPPFYRPIMVAERNWWEAPAQGVLAGEVLSVASDTSSFVVKDFSGTIRIIDADDLRAPDLRELIVGATVRIIGAPASATSTEHLFHACFVFPWNADQEVVVPPPAGERSPAPERSDECKGIRPYGALHALHGE